MKIAKLVGKIITIINLQWPFSKNMVLWKTNNCGMILCIRNSTGIAPGIIETYLQFSSDFESLPFTSPTKILLLKKLVTCQKSSWLSSWRRGTAFFVIVQGACAKFPTWTTRYEITQFPDSERVLNCENVSKTCATTWWVTYARKKSINSSGDRIDGSIKRES